MSDTREIMTRSSYLCLLCWKLSRFLFYVHSRDEARRAINRTVMIALHDVTHGEIRFSETIDITMIRVEITFPPIPGNETKYNVYSRTAKLYLRTSLVCYSHVVKLHLNTGRFRFDIIKL